VRSDEVIANRAAGFTPHAEWRRTCPLPGLTVAGAVVVGWVENGVLHVKVRLDGADRELIDAGGWDGLAVTVEVGDRVVASDLTDIPDR
jgi:hypothetical protein